VRVQLDPAAMADRGIVLTTLTAAHSQRNPNTATGSLYGKYTNLTLQTNVEPKNADEFARSS